MTDTQFGALMAAITGFAASLVATLRWAVNRLTKALDTNSESHLKSAEAMAVMSTKLDFVYGATAKVQEFVQEERSGVHDAAYEESAPVQIPGKRTKTPPIGVTQYGPLRPKTEK